MDTIKDLNKIISIPGGIVKDLKKMAINADTDLKNYIQQMLVDKVESARANLEV